MKEKQGVFAWMPEHSYQRGRQAYRNVRVQDAEKVLNYRSRIKHVLFTPTITTNDGETNGDDEEEDEELVETTTTPTPVMDRSSSSLLIAPRKYQDELFNECKNGNVIAVAPTGAGKTYIALLMIMDVLETDPTKKVLFVVNLVPLVIQQASAFRKLLPSPYNDRVGMIYGERGNEDWEYTMSSYDIIVGTAQAVMNGLQKYHTDLSPFQLVIIDECHHAKTSHPYRTLMQRFYFPMKRAGKVTPKILGLSASPAAHNTTVETLLSILQICHNIDCKVRKVEKNEAELHEMINLPTILQMEVDMDRVSAQFRRLIQNALIIIKNALIELLDVTERRPEIEIETDFSSEEMKQWIENIVQQGNETQKEEEHEELNQFLEDGKGLDSASRSQRAAYLGRILNMLYESLIVNDDRSCFHAWQELLPLIQQAKKNSYFTDLLNRAGIHEKAFELRDLPRDCTKRFALLDVLKKREQVPDFRALIFVKTRIGAYELRDYLKKHAGNFSVDLILGHGKVKGVNGMSVTKQRQILNDFKSGKIQILIATSVAEEGIDIPSCKLVIRMDGIDSVLQLIQSRGRARSKQSEFVCIFHRHSKDVNKMRRCLIQEQKMFRAISILNYAEQFHDDVYLHRLHMKDDSEEHAMTLSHIWEAIWFYKDCDIYDDLLDKLFHKYKYHYQNALKTSIEKALGVTPQIYVDKKLDGRYHGYTSFTIGNVCPTITRPYQAATRMVIDSNTLEPRIQDAKNSAVMHAVRILKEKDLLIFPSNSWVDVYKDTFAHHTSTEQQIRTKDLEILVKKTKSKGKSIKVTEMSSKINEENAINVLQHHCMAVTKQLPSYQDHREGHKYYTLCVLPDGSASTRSDSNVKKKLSKKAAAYKMCLFLIKRDGFIWVPESLM
jgi:ERCC4-related helicase